ncbi:MAG: right-handed parallel beta-helix repeat-containing protein [Ruminococcaceae bacterium]|nr:right-handed parallel beta-helix repeat-containing protein [Oscillospiraceae bacterium]
MNQLCELFLHIQDGDIVTLEQGATYHIRQDDSYTLTGYYCTNTATIPQNPNGLRHTAMYLKGKKHITIDGNGATVMVHGKMTPFLFDACEHITVKNLTVDYAAPTMTEFTVLSVEGKVCDIRFHPGSLFRVEGSDLYFCSDNGLDGKPYWEEPSNGGPRFTLWYDPVAEVTSWCGNGQFTFDAIEILDDRTLRLTFKDPGHGLIPGRVIQSRNIVRDQTGALFQRCKNLTFESLRVKFMHGLGMVSQFCENVTFKNCDFTPGEGRTITSTADFFQFSGCRGKIVVDGCRASGAQDDFINVHGTHLRVVETDPATRSMTVRFMHHETWGIQAFEVGDELEFIRWDTLQPYAETVVTAWEKLNDTDIRLTLDRDLPEGIVPDKDVVENATWTPDLYVRNCDAFMIACRGVLCTTRGEVIIENNRFYHLRGPALVVEDDCNFWFESGYTRHVIFRNNQVIGCNYGNNYPGGPLLCYSPKVMDPNSEAFVHGKLTVENNVFRQPYRGNHVFRFEYLGEAEIVGNTFDAALTVDPHHCGNVTVRDNIETV